MTVHPGIILREHMQMRRLRIKHLVNLSGVSRATIESILNSRGQITIKTALKLADAFQYSPAFWLRLQYEYTLARLTCRYEEQTHDNLSCAPKNQSIDEFIAGRLEGFLCPLPVDVQAARDNGLIS